MASSESVGWRFLLSFGLFVVVSCSFCNCASLTRLEALRRFQGQAKGSLVHHGRLLIGQSSLQGAKPKITEAADVVLDVDSDYQADMVWEHPTEWGAGPSRLSPDSRAVEQLLKLEPEVECTGDSMQLNVRNTASTPGSLFLVDRGGHLPPLPLSKLPPSCGFTFKSTKGHLVFVAPYDGCFVAREEDSYVLPLRWFGLAVRMSCPLTRPSAKPPMVTCHSEGMIVKTGWTFSVAKIGVKLKGGWEPLMKASSSCGFSVVVHPEGVTISAHYAPCLEEKDGMYTLELTGDGESTISCPSLSASHPEPVESSDPHPDHHHQHSRPPALPPFPASSPGKHHDTVAPDPQVPHYPFLFYAPPAQPGLLPAHPPVTEPPVKHPAGHPEHHEPSPSSPFVFYNQPLVDQAFFNEPHTEHFFYQDPFHHGFSASDHYPMPMPLQQETFASHAEAPQAPPGLVQQLEQVPAPSSDGKNPHSLIHHPSSGGSVPPDAPWFSPVHCPKVCPSGFANCCPQMALHQYLHLAPAGFGRKRTGFGGSWDSAHNHHQNPAEPLQAHSASTSAPASLQSRVPGNRHEYLQPQDGVHAAHPRRHPTELPNFKLPENFYNLPHVDPFYPVPYNVPSRAWAPGYHSFNQMAQSEPHNVHGPKQPRDHHFMNHHFGQNQHKPAAWQLQQSHPQARELPDLDPFHVPDSTLQDGQAPNYKTPLVPASQTQQLVNAIKDYTAHDQTVHSDSEPKSNVLLHHGPPGWRFSGWSDSHLPFVAQNPGQSFPREQYHRAAWDK